MSRIDEDELNLFLREHFKCELVSEVEWGGRTGRDALETFKEHWEWAVKRAEQFPKLDTSWARMAIKAVELQLEG